MFDRDWDESPTPWTQLPSARAITAEELNEIMATLPPRMDRLYLHASRYGAGVIKSHLGPAQAPSPAIEFYAGLNLVEAKYHPDDLVTVTARAPLGDFQARIVGVFALSAVVRALDASVRIGAAVKALFG